MMEQQTRRAIWTTLAVALVAAAYLGYVFGSRWMDARERDRDAALLEAKAIPPALRDEKLKILSFHATPAGASEPGAMLLCYGVLNATWVRIEPEPGGVTPSMSRCVPVRPKLTTEYRLIAGNAKGELSEKLTIERK